MSPFQRYASLILLTLFLALLLGGCDGKKSRPEQSSTAAAEAPRSPEPVTPATADSSDADPSDEITEHTDASGSATLDPDALLASLTADNAQEIRAALRALPDQWRGRVGPFYRSWAQADPVTALDAALSDEGSDRHSCAAKALEGWAAIAPDAARGWVEQQPAGKLRYHYTRGLIKGTPPGRLDTLSTWAATVADDEAALPMITELAGTRAATDPAGTAAWLDQLPPGPARQQAARALFRTWAENDAPAASDYLATVERAPIRDEAISAFARAIAAEDFEAAGIWANEIADPELRAQTLAALPKVRDYHAMGLD